MQARRLSPSRDDAQLLFIYLYTRISSVYAHRFLGAENTPRSSCVRQNWRQNRRDSLLPKNRCVVFFCPPILSLIVPTPRISISVKKKAGASPLNVIPYSLTLPLSFAYDYIIVTLSPLRRIIIIHSRSALIFFSL